MKSYINVYASNHSNITHTYIENGERKREVVPFQPIYGYKVDRPTDWTDIFGNYLETVRFSSMPESRTWRNDNQGIFQIYGEIQHPLAFISQTYTGDIPLQKEQMNIYAIDIECYSETGGFPKAQNMGDFINAITFLNMVTGRKYVYGLKDYKPTQPNTFYVKCNDEAHLLEEIIDFFNRQDIDIITGWYIEAFDIPYMINRMNLILGEDSANRLSPNRKLSKGSKTINKREVDIYRIMGISTMDYLNLYQKFTYDNKDSYTLDNIVKCELGEAKLDYKAYSNLNNLYDENPTLFYDYNVKDVELILALDDKLKFMDIALNYAYMMKCDLEGIFGTVRPWDAFLYSELYQKNVLASPNKSTQAQDFGGGYVKDPLKGFVRWVSVYDIVSSYPNQIISSNMSPETLVPMSYINQHPELKEMTKAFYGVEACLDIENLKVITEVLKKHNVCYTPNGQFFYTDRKGFLADVVSRVFQKRVDIKKQIKKATSKHDKDLLSSQSQIIKIAINSCYGAVGCEHFRYYDTRIAEAVTMQGQLCARGVATHIVKTLPHVDWIYQDTDSCFFHLEKIINARYKDNIPDDRTVLDFVLKYQDKILSPAINQYFIDLGKTLNVNKMTIEMEHECIADKNIFVQKKMYVMHQVHSDGKDLLDNPKYKMKGLAMIKTAAYPELTRNEMKKVTKMIFDGKSKDDVSTEIAEFKKQFVTSAPDQISTPISVNTTGNKTLPNGSKVSFEWTISTSGLPKQVRAAFVFNNALEDLGLTNKYQKIMNGNKIRYINIKQPNRFNSYVIGYIEKIPTEILDHIKVDFDEQWESTFKKPMTAVLDAVDYTFEKVATLEDFF